MIIFYDTCSLLNNLHTIFQSENKIYISNISLIELENIKTSATKDEETKYNARLLLHMLEENENKYEIIIYKTYMDEILVDFSLPNNNDSKIIVSAIKLYKDLQNKEDFFFDSDDLSCRSIAKSCGLPLINKNKKNIEEYKGFIEARFTEIGLANFYQNTLINNINEYDLLENQYIIIKNEDDWVLDKYKWKNNKYEKIPFQKAESKMFGKIVPKNGDIYQQLALDSLYSNKITMIRGAAGTGKSYLSFGFMFNLLEQGKIDKIIIFCNTVATKGSAKLGYYPGSRDEKLLDSQIGNLLVSKIGDRIMVEKLIADGTIVLLPMSDIRGYDTTGMNAAIYISEAQNLDIELMRLALQRVGEDSVCILDGDSNAQVDSSLYAGSNNGMRRVSEIFKGSDIYGEVTLQNIHRSKIAELAQKL